MIMPPVVILDFKRFQPRHAGEIPSFLDIEDERPAVVQLNERYQHGGGWRPQDGFTQDKGVPFRLNYPGDPPLDALAAIPFRKELILIYPLAYVAVIQEDGSFVIARMD